MVMIIAIILNKMSISAVFSIIKAITSLKVKKMKIPLIQMKMIDNSYIFHLFNWIKVGNWIILVEYMMV